MGKGVGGTKVDVLNLTNCLTKFASDLSDLQTMSQSSDDEVVGNRAWIDACKSRGHLQFWLINLLMTIPICFRLAFFSGEISYKPGRLVGFDDILTVGHLLQGCFCAGCLFLSHRFDAGSLCGGRFPRFKTCVLVCYTVSALVYPVYNLNKRLITSMPFFADSSYFSNQADFLLGLLIGYLLVSAFALFAHFYHRNLTCFRIDGLACQR